MQNNNILVTKEIITALLAFRNWSNRNKVIFPRPLQIDILAKANMLEKAVEIKIVEDMPKDKAAIIDKFEGFLVLFYTLKNEETRISHKNSKLIEALSEYLKKTHSIKANTRLLYNDYENSSDEDNQDAKFLNNFYQEQVYTIILSKKDCNYILKGKENFSVELIEEHMNNKKSCVLL